MITIAYENDLFMYASLNGRDHPTAQAEETIVVDAAEEKSKAGIDTKNTSTNPAMPKDDMRDGSSLETTVSVVTNCSSAMLVFTVSKQQCPNVHSYLYTVPAKHNNAS